MITIIVGTNRNKSEAGKFAKYYEQELVNRGKKVNFIHLKDIAPDLYHAEMYDEPMQQTLRDLQDEIMIPTKKFVFVIPEYNGGMPGALKLFIDALSIRLRNETFSGKKAAIVGVSAGRAGNLRGMEHLTGVLNYLNTTVLPNRQPYSSIHQIMDKSGVLIDELSNIILKAHVEQIINF